MQYDREQITRTLDALTRGLYPFLERELKAVYQDKWHETAKGSFREARGQGRLNGGAIRWDAHTILTVMWDQWNRVFRRKLGHLERSLVSELREFRNRWAHQTDFSFDDSYRILDSIERLLKAVDAPEAEQVAREKRELLRQQFSREARAAYKKAQQTRRKWQDFSIYTFCCAAIDFVIFDMFGPEAWFFALFVVFVFAYLAYQRFVTPMQLYFGPHECEGCRKIIYGDSCPYCEKQTPPSKSPPPAVESDASDEPAETETAASV